MLIPRTLLAPLFLLLTGAAAGQAIPASFVSETETTTASASTNDSGPVGIIPLTRGFNASFATTTQHDSSNGWSSALTPDLAYRFNSLFSLNAGIPIYASIHVEQTKGTKAKPVYVQSTQQGVVGDATLAAQFTIPSFIDYNATVTLGLPSGNTSYGLGAGQPTYDINNHFEKVIGFLTPDIELGFGDSSSLIGARIRKSYTAVGTLAHFQAGTAVDLPLNMSFEADAYEQLPLDASTIYSTTGKGKKKITTATGTTAAEDNGFITSLDLPFSRHLTVSGFYNRSLRSHDDVAGFSFTFLLKPPPQPDDISR